MNSQCHSAYCLPAGPSEQVSHSKKPATCHNGNPLCYTNTIPTKFTLILIAVGKNTHRDRERETEREREREREESVREKERKTD